MYKVMYEKIAKFKLLSSIFIGVLFLTLAMQPVRAEYELKVSVNKTGLLKHLLGNVNGVRIAFLDVSDLDFIYLTEILLDGTVVSRVPLVPNTLALEEKVRETIYYRKSSDSYFLGWHGKGVYEFDRLGKQLNFIETPPLTHDIFVDEVGLMTFAHSWSGEDEPQAFQVDKAGKVVWRWNAKQFIKSNKFKKAVNRKEPENFAAATSAVPLGDDLIAVTLSAWNVIAIVNKKSGKVVEYIVDTRRPHSVVSDGEKVIGYTSRSMSGLRKHGPTNSLVAYNAEKKMFSRAFADGIKSLDLQSLGNGLWLLPNGPDIKIMDGDGVIYWQLDIANYLLLDSPRYSFSNAILIGLQANYQRPEETYLNPDSDAVCKFSIKTKKLDKRNNGKELARLSAGFIQQKGSEVVFHIQTGWGFKKQRKDLLANKHKLEIKNKRLQGTMLVFPSYKSVEDEITEPVEGKISVKFNSGYLENGIFPLEVKSGFSIKAMAFELSECVSR